MEATDLHTKESVTLNGYFRVLGEWEEYYCSATMINTGTQPLPEGCVQFVAFGREAKDFECKINKRDDILCNVTENNCTCKFLNYNIMQIVLLIHLGWDNYVWCTS